MCCLVSLVKTIYIRLSIFLYSLQSNNIYIKKLINSSKIYFYDYLVQLKQKLQIEKFIYDKGNLGKFEQFEFILDNIYKYMYHYFKLSRVIKINDS